MKFLTTRRGWNIASAVMITAFVAISVVSLLAAPSSVDPSLARAEGLFGLGFAAIAAVLLFVVAPSMERAIEEEESR